MIFDWDFFIFVGALSVAAFAPGPGLAAIVATVLARGAKRAVWFCVGMIIGDLTWLILSLSGLAVIAQKIPIVFLAIKWGGVAYLCYLAFKIWRSEPDAPASVAHPQQRNIPGRVLAGYAVTMGNPKAMLFYLALLPSIVKADHISIALTLSLGLAVIMVLSVVFAIYVIAANKARQMMTSGRAVRTFNRITATALGGAAAWIAFR
ncbi:LysE family translocator [Cohaesibacter gelatinilyticus]|uniref:Threonine/homoserine/homoserine lactone efflux protein n=1 Tax=Cohaesibacter gelatinilyticus TaxID=372072 RepID=A0A285PBL0_9HYPH|nr:LysE family translocator [Cohaesibacter gelatinilyticus]SNZ19150.1 Threonine/homoserine/homoserine lactone efflux protein [Cohaesibacter gelatinilyticus]